MDLWLSFKEDGLARRIEENSVPEPTVYSFEAPSPTEVKINLKDVDTHFPESMADFPVVPEHIWKDVADPLAFKNETPVGSGPMTEIRRFTPQVYEQCRNPNYWDAASLKVDCLKLPQIAGNDQMLALLPDGQMDWIGSFLPEIDKTYVGLDNGMKRHDSVKDIGALLDWIATQPDLDAGRVVVTGGSYGGYMTLATFADYNERLAGAIDTVGISNWLTFLANTEGYRRDLRRAEYGDERLPRTRAYLQRISPLTNAARISKPLLVVQGLNDPRVPATESQQMVAKIRARGGEVWYLAAKDEGHGFKKKANRDFYQKTVVTFLEKQLAAK